MKYFMVGLLVQIITLSAFAASFTTQIHSVDRGKEGEKYLIMLNNGHTAFIDSQAKSLIEAVEQSQLNGNTVQINLDRK